MRIKRLIVLIAFFAAHVAGAQSGSAKPAQPANTKLHGGSIQSVTGVEHDTCIGKKFSVVFYFMQDSIGSKTPQNTQWMRDTVINELNRTFSRICVKFESCSTVIIPHYTFNEWYSSTTDQVATSNWYTENTINIYMPYVVKVGYFSDEHAYAHSANTWGAYPSSKEVVVVETKTTVTTIWSPNNAGFFLSHLLHAMGHYFGLPDTYGEVGPPASPPPPPGASSHEFADGSNCATNGDGICDTDADCYGLSYYPALAPIKTHCAYYPNVKDGKGDYYSPPLDNFMSQYTCRCRFTQMQYNKMARYIVTNKKHLH